MILDSELRDIIKRIFEIRAIEIRTERGMPNSSTQPSPVSIDFDRIFSDPMLRKRVLKQWIRRLELLLGSKPSEGTVIVGMAVAGIVPAFALADAFGCQFAYAQVRDESCHKGGRCFSGIWSPGMNVIVADDLILTGKTILRTVEQLRSDGGNVVCATSIASSEFGSALRGFQEANITTHSLLKLTEIFDVGYSMGVIGNREMRVVMDWMSLNEVSIF
jgi:orotate phosphoribosyltransferase